jgi:hypothetical protein
VGQVGVGFDPLPELIEDGRRLEVDADEVLPRKVEVVFANLKAFGPNVGGE